jgi:hypothetical protein
MIVPFSLPAELILLVAGREEAKNLAGKKILRLIQIRVATPSLEKSRLLVKHNRRKAP